MDKKFKLAIAGCGKLSEIVAEAVINHILPDYELCACYSRTFEKAQKLSERINQSTGNRNCQACKSIEELLQSKPDYLVEAASPKAMLEIALPALKQGTSVVTLSIGALADHAFYNEVKETARNNQARVYIVSGAIGGFDVLRTSSLMDGSTVCFTNTKGPNALKDTEIYSESLQHEEKTVFEGTASEAIALFPTKVNVAVAASLASVGPENIKVKVRSVPGFTGDDQRVEIKNSQVHAVIDVYSKTAEIAGWSVVNTLRNICSPIVF